MRKLRDHSVRTPSNLDILELHTREVLRRLEMCPWEEASIMSHDYEKRLSCSWKFFWRIMKSEQSGHPGSLTWLRAVESTVLGPWQGLASAFSASVWSRMKRPPLFADVFECLPNATCSSRLQGRYQSEKNLSPCPWVASILAQVGRMGDKETD